MTNFDLEVLVLTSDESQHFNTLNLSEKSLFFPSLIFHFFHVHVGTRVSSRETGKNVNLMLLSGHDDK